MKNAILFGASSEIGLAIIQEYCGTDAWRYIKAGSHSKEIDGNSEFDLHIDWKNLRPIEDFSISEIESLKIDFAVVSLGYLPEPSAQTSGNEIIQSTFANLIWPLLCLEWLNRKSLMRDTGIIIVVSSALVTLPPTRKNFLYTILKSSMEKIILNGIRFGNFEKKIIILRPGYVPTKINEHLSPGKYGSTPGQIAVEVVKVIRSGKKSGVVYAPALLKYLIPTTKLVPYKIRRFFLSLIQNS